MKLSFLLSSLVLGFFLAVPEVSAQTCPFSVTLTNYGSSCSSLTTSTPSLVGLTPSGGSCDVQFFHDVPLVCCNVNLTNRWFVIGLMPTSASLPGGGCALLVNPLLIIDLPALEGTIAPLLLLPPTTALIGASIYVQGIDRRFDTIAGKQHIETTNGIRLDIQ